MAVKLYKPTSPGRRIHSVTDYSVLHKTEKSPKNLVVSKRKQAGRNNTGKITVRHQGGGARKKIRLVDFSREDRLGIPGIVKSIEYDPTRTAFISLVAYKDGVKRYVLTAAGMKVGQEVLAGETAEIVPGNRLALKNIPVGTFVYNIEIKPMGGAKIARSAGIAAQVVANADGYTNIKMPSSEIRKVPDSAWASIGEVSNEEHKLKKFGKAGRSRRMGIRPTVRGTAMNPVDHPHGGGEGRQGRGHRRQRSLWGKPTGKGQKSRTPKKYSNTFIVSRRKVGKKRNAD